MPKMTKVTKQCAYCGEPATTRDHIPPKRLFPKPLPSDLMTVPACAIHNHEASDDDEYFIWAVTMSEKAVGSQANAARQQRLAPPGSPRRRRMAKRLMSQASWVNVVTPSGLYLRRAVGFNIDQERVGSVLTRILRGLYFKELGQRVPKKCEVLGIVNPPARTLDADTIAALLRRRRNIAAGGAFEYWFSTAEDAPQSAICFMRFFGGLPAVGFVMDPSIETNKGMS